MAFNLAFFCVLHGIDVHGRGQSLGSVRPRKLSGQASSQPSLESSFRMMH